MRALPWSLRQISICTVATYTLFENHFKILNLQDWVPGAYTVFPDDILHTHQKIETFLKSYFQTPWHLYIVSNTYSYFAYSLKTGHRATDFLRTVCVFF